MTGTRRALQLDGDQVSPATKRRLVARAASTDMAADPPAAPWYAPSPLPAVQLLPFGLAADVAPVRRTPTTPLPLPETAAHMRIGHYF